MKCKRKALHILYVSISGLIPPTTLSGMWQVGAAARKRAELKASLEVIRTTADENDYGYIREVKGA